VASALELSLDERLALLLGKLLDPGRQRRELLAPRRQLRRLRNAVVVLVEVNVDGLVAK
jgi:hypothetical protein